jgi:O-succinylbenzoic acid--CoA ligase
MHELLATAQTGTAFVETMQRAWENGDAILPIDPRLPDAAVSTLLSAMRPSRLVLADGSTRALDASRPIEDGDALVVATSGSTGNPKGVVHTHASLRASAISTSTALGVEPATDRWLCCLPLSHIAGLAVVIRSLTFDMPFDILDRFEATAVMAAARNGATLTSLVPTALARVEASLFRRIIVGGSAAPASLPANCRMSYGMTETGSAVVFDGLPLPGVELRIAEGEIQIRGDMLLRAYRDGTDPRTDDGWLRTNDAGEIGEDGVLHVSGRRGDLIISGGENIWPTPVESALELLDSVAEVAIVGRPDPEWGQVVTAVVVPSDPASPPDLDSLRNAVKAVLPAFCAPRRLELVTALPRTALGKVQRGNLAPTVPEYD